jgi:hypothetical protein
VGENQNGSTGHVFGYGIRNSRHKFFLSKKPTLRIGRGTLWSLCLAAVGAYSGVSAHWRQRRKYSGVRHTFSRYLSPS